MKILKILLFFLGLFIFVLGTDAYLGVDDVITALNEAVELDAPVILPENEGKIVILHGYSPFCCLLSCRYARSLQRRR